MSISGTEGVGNGSRVGAQRKLAGAVVQHGCRGRCHRSSLTGERGGNGFLLARLLLRRRICAGEAAINTSTHPLVFPLGKCGAVSSPSFPAAVVNKGSGVPGTRMPPTGKKKHTS